ncbi:MAG: Ig-like domain-containing protein, partial [Phycicoccus sp.]
GYRISNGVFDPSRSTVLVRPVEGYVNPPVARDDVAAPKPGESSALVDVLANDTDIDSDPATLEVDRVLSPDATVEDGEVRVRVLDRPHTVPYVIRDEDGAESMAVVFVPTGAGGQPFVVPSTLIQLDKDSTTTVELNDHVRSPRGRVVSVTSAETLSASPAATLAVSMPDNRTLTLESSGGYVGPAAVMLEVTDQDAVDQKDFGTAYVSIPVQIGPKVPLLRCPDGPVTVLAGGVDRVIDIPTFCRAWLPVGMTVDDVRFETRWTTEAAGAELRVDDDGRRVTLRAGADARTSSGVLSVVPEGQGAPSTINVRVQGGEAFPPPRLRPISVAGLAEGESTEVDVAAYLDSPLARPQCAIDSARVESGAGLTASASGCRLTLTAGDKP